MLGAAGIEGIFVAHNAVSGYQAFLEHKPDVIVVDLTLHAEKLGGIGLIKRMHSKDQDAKILVLSMHADPGIFVSAIEAGATGYLIKDAPTEELAKAVHQLRAGNRYIDAQFALKLAFLSNALSPRERRVLELLMEGTPYASIADQLGISRKAAMNLTVRVRRRLGERNFDPQEPI